MDRRIIIVIPAERLSEANSLSGQVDINRIPGSFSSQALSPTGELPATHYLCGWLFTENEFKKMAELFGPSNIWADVFDLELYTHDKILETLGLTKVRPTELRSFVRVKKWYEIKEEPKEVRDGSIK